MSSKVGRWRLRKRANRLVLREDNIDDASDSSDDDQIEPPRRLRFRYEDEAIVDANQLDPDPGSDSAASIDNNVIIDIIHDLNNESGMDEAPDYFDDADQRADEQPPDYFDDANQRADEQPPDYFDDANQRADEQVCANLVLGPVVNHRIDGNDDIADLNINDGIVNEGLSSDSEQPSDDDDNEQENVSEVSEEEGEEEERQEPNNRHLYPGAQLTFKESLIAILTFVLSHHLTGNSLIDLISLIILHCPMNSSCVKSLHYFKKIFRDVGKEIIVCHYFCSVCFKLLSQRNAACEQCNRVTGSSYFIEIPLLNQLQILFNRPGFYNQLQFRFLRQKKHANNIEDIYDGAIYTGVQN